MKKTITTLLSLVLCLALLLTLGACKIDFNNLDSTSTSELTAEEKEDSFALLDNFMKATFESGNFVVTTKQGENTRVENVVGDASCTVDSATNTTMWAFQKDGKFISAASYLSESENEEGEIETTEQYYYMTDKESYNGYYCNFWSEVKAMKASEALTDEVANFSCVAKAEEKTESGVTESKADLTFTITPKDGDAKITITAHAENDLVKSITYRTSSAAGERTVTLTFTYGNAKVEIPDITDWDDITYYGEEDGESNSDNDEDANEGTEDSEG